MDNDKTLKDKLFDFYSKLTWPRLLISIVTAFLIIFSIALYENRQTVFNEVVNKSIAQTEYTLNPPTNIGKAILDRLIVVHPEIVMISIVDADQISNRQRIIYRVFNNSTVETIIKETSIRVPNLGDGDLLTSDQSNNIQILAILNGEFFCAPSSGFLFSALPVLKEHITYQCRVPLPPAYNRATGWLTIHLRKLPIEDFNILKSDALIASLEYYNKEVLKLN